MAEQGKERGKGGGWTGCEPARSGAGAHRQWSVHGQATVARLASLYAARDRLMSGLDEAVRRQEGENRRIRRVQSEIARLEGNLAEIDAILNES